MDREQLIVLVAKIQNGEGTEQEQDHLLEQLEQNVSHPEVSNLIFWDKRELTAEQIVDEALAYQPIRLQP
ncbi:bacteriocin immunity protein [Paenibacillus dauci]|uniref:bacteriocin immunity protein n=1 Tax=Paenibacillus dauci TaxID=1567106 RepID=UPI0006197074|nr:bacteriocin immunity protein [Paenibacillus dauci]